MYLSNKKYPSQKKKKKVTKNIFIKLDKLCKY